MMYKKILLGTVLAVCIFGSKASEETNSISEAITDTDPLTPEEEAFLAAARAEADATIESAKIAAGALVKASECLGVESAKVAANALIKASEGLGVESAKIVADVSVKVSESFGVEAAQIAADALVKSSEGFGVEAAKIWAEGRKEAARIKAEADINASKKNAEKFGLWKPICGTAIFICAAGAVISIFNR